MWYEGMLMTASLCRDRALRHLMSVCLTHPLSRSLRPFASTLFTAATALRLKAPGSRAAGESAAENPAPQPRV